MRLSVIMAVTAAALGFGLSQPAAAGGWDDSHCCYGGYGGKVYIHHHVYAPPRYVHVYQFHRPAARHYHVVNFRPGCCNYFAPRRAHRWHHFRRYW
jgi:hypothetical protein